MSSEKTDETTTCRSREERLVKLECRTGGCCPLVDPMGTFLYLHVPTTELMMDAEHGRVITMLTRKQLKQALGLLREE